MAAALAAALIASALPAEAGAGGLRAASRPPENGQIALVTPMRLWQETGWLAYILGPRDRTPALHAGGRTFRVFWAGAAVGAPSTTVAMQRTKLISRAVVVDRPLTAAERRRWKTVPLYTDADVLVAAATSPLCTAGLTLAEVHRALTGRLDAWSTVVASWPAEVPAGVTVYVPPDREFARPMFDVQPRSPTDHSGLRYGTATKIAGDGELVAIAAAGTAVAATSYQRARGAIDAGRVCAIPVNGVLPSVAALRSRAYPVTRPVGLAFRKVKTDPVTLAIRRYWLGVVTGPKGEAALAAQFGAGLIPGW